jgi:TMEM199 family protein
MSGPTQPDILRVSLEPHLAEKLQPLVHTIPAPLSAELSPLLSETSSSSTPTISYTLLSSLSRWVRTEEGARALKSEDPPLDPLAYGMVTLLAGTRTSPDKKFPQSWPSSSRSEGAAREINDRRAIIAVLNAFLSVICTGAGVWWAAQRTGWRDEWVGTYDVSTPEPFVPTLLEFEFRKFSCRCSPQQ